MQAPIIYDITRLLTRIANDTPNGIDRVDITFATHLLDAAKTRSAGLISTPLGSRLVSDMLAREAVQRIARHWGEMKEAGDDEALASVEARIRGESVGSTPAAKRVKARRSGRIAKALKFLTRHPGIAGSSPARHAPQGARYVNVSQFPLWLPSAFRWLEERPDLRAVFFIHDLLPLEVPEYFRPAEYERHRHRLANLARFGSGAIVTTGVVRDALIDHLADLGRRDLPVLVQPLPVAPIFRERSSPEEPPDPPYFVVCSTIEPRKNHLLLLHVWRELVRRQGMAAPKLVIVGNRGWENENVVDLLDRCRSIQDHVIEVSGLTTPGLKRLMDGARALLMPSFAEGFGLPVAEALSAGIPVVASDIPTFREIGGQAIIPISPIDGEAWLRAITDLSMPGSAVRRHAVTRSQGVEPISWGAYFTAVEGFLEAL